MSWVAADARGGHRRWPGVPAAHPLRPQRGRRARPHRLRHPPPGDPRPLRPRQPGDPLDRRPHRRRRSRPPDPDRPLRRPRTRACGWRCSARSAWALFSFAHRAGLDGVGPRRRPLRVPVIGKAVVDPTHNSLIADYYAPDHRPKVYSFHRAANAVGAFIGPLLAGIIAFNTSWRVPFFVFAIPTLIIVVLGLRVKEPVRGEHERRAMGASEEAVADRGGAAELRRGVAALRNIETPPPDLVGAAVPRRLAHRLRCPSPASSTRRSSTSTSEPAASWPRRRSRRSSSGSIVGGRIGAKLVVRDPGPHPALPRHAVVLRRRPARRLRPEPVALAVRRRSTRSSPARPRRHRPRHLRRAGHGDPAASPVVRASASVRCGCCPACSSSRSSVPSGTAGALRQAMLLMLPVFVDRRARSSPAPAA